MAVDFGAFAAAAVLDRLLIIADEPFLYGFLLLLLTTMARVLLVVLSRALALL